MLRSNTAEFIAKARKIHGDKYDYSSVNYENNAIKIVVICRAHGSFIITPNSHLRGVGCAKCGGNARYNTDEFIKKREVCMVTNMIIVW